MDWNRISIARLALAAALCSIPGIAQAETVRLAATLSGANEPAGGHPAGSATFSVEIDSEAGDFCYLLTITGIGRATAAHLHQGAAGTVGEAKVPLEVTGPSLDMCVAIDPADLQLLLDTPADFYINVHTAAHPEGAVRGQLERR